jgi:nucleotide-binding universal stress UspA family protein
MLKKILVPLDGSSRAEMILPSVQSLAENCNVHVVLLKVMEPSVMLGHDEVIDIGAYQEQRRALQLNDERYLYAVGERFASENINYRVKVESGAVVATILAVAEQEDVDLVAMASHRMSERIHVLPKSTTIKVMLHTDRPMFVQHSQQNAA